jgi:hypothetical protein
MGIDKVSTLSRTTAALPRIGSKKILAGVVAAVAAGAAPSAFAEIELGQGISVTGFADMSLYSDDTDGEAASFGIDQFEVDFLFTGSNGISAQVDIEYSPEYEGTSTTFVEQAFITKQFTDQFSMKVGRFLSYSGWETEEPTGLFQYSGVGYASAFYGYYQNGVSAYYDGGKFALMGSVVTSTINPNDTDTSDLGYEVGVAIMPVEGFTAKAFYIKDEDTDSERINVWASYAWGGFTFAGEYNTADYGAAGDGDGFLLMANYATGPWGFTVRYHDYEVDGVADLKGFTFSPSYKVSDNLLLVAEYRKDKYAGGGPKPTTAALEALFTF